MTWLPHRKPVPRKQADFSLSVHRRQLGMSQYLYPTLIVFHRRDYFLQLESMSCPQRAKCCKHSASAEPRQSLKS